MWEQSPDASSTRAAGEGGAQAAGRRPCPPLAGTRARLCVQGRGRGIAGSSGSFTTSDRQSMTPTEETHGAQTSAADVREAAIFTQGWARAEPVGGAGRLGAKGVWSWGAGLLAHWGITHSGRASGPGSPAHWGNAPVHLPALLQRVGRLRAEGTGVETPAGRKLGHPWGKNRLGDTVRGTWE